MNPKTRDLGELSGTLLLFGGIYSNLPALQAVQLAAQQLAIPPDRVICTGDIVGYCAQPEETVQAVRNWGIHTIAGNVEQQLSSGADDCGCDFRPGSRCDTFSRHWYPYAQEQLSEASVNWMALLPDQLRFQYNGHKVIVLHGSYRETAEYVFRSTSWQDKAAIMADAGADIVVAGHCGLPFSQQHAGRYWLNPGVVGMPANDGTTRVWAMILRATAAGIEYEHLPLEYDHLQAQQLMRERGLPESYALTLSTGLWDNCEILPEQETREQGKRLELAKGKLVFS